MPPPFGNPAPACTAILVHQGALGDWVLTFPLLASLARRGGVLAVSHPSKAKLAARLIAGVRADDVESARWSALHAGRHDAIPRDDSVELVVSFVSGGGDAWARAARLAWPRAKFAFVAPRPPGDWSRHVTQWHAQQLAAQGVALSPVPFECKTDHVPATIRRVLIHPGSGGADKCWPAERFERLAHALRARGMDPRFVIGEVEMERWPAEVLRRLRNEHGAAALDTLDALADAVAWCDAFIGNDSGPTHLAAFMGKRVVAMFGPSSPRVWAPLGDRVILLAPPTPRAMDWLDVDTVAACLI